jgi:outer membrane protein assembly factor BamB
MRARVLDTVAIDRRFALPRRRSRQSRTLAVALLALFPLVLGSCDWAQFRYGDSGTGFNPFERVIGVGNVSGLHRRWSESSAAPGAESSPVVVNGIVYATSTGGRIDAFDAATGVGKWSVPIGSTVGPPSPAVGDGAVYVSTSTGLDAFNAADGTKLWSTNVGAQLSAPVVAGGIVYSDELYGAVVAIDATTGTVLWSADIGAGGEVPAVASGVVYVGGYGGALLYALNATTGSVLWYAPPAGSGNPFSSAAVSNNVVYASGDKLYAFNATTGARLWSATTGGGAGPPAVAKAVVYESLNDGRVAAFNATTGASIWFSSTGAMSRATAPVVANGVVYVGGADGRVHAFKATSGIALWSAVGAGAPVVVNGVVYVGGSESVDAYSMLPGVRPGLTVSPTFAPDYGTVLDGASSSPRTFTVTNIGPSATTPISDSIRGTDPSQFHVVSDTCRATALSRAASCTVKVTFNPTLPGAQTATLSLDATAGGQATATLSGSGNPLTIDPATYDYGVVMDGTSSAATFTITNHSASAVLPDVADLGSPFGASSETCNRVSVPAGGTCTVTVTFAPTGSGGVLSTSLPVTATGLTTTAHVTGDAQAETLTPLTKDYGVVPIGSSSAAIFTITNLSSVSVSGACLLIGHEFAAACGGIVLDPRASYNLAVAFTPKVGGTRYDGTLELNPFATGAMVKATLTGTGG